MNENTNITTAAVPATTSIQQLVAAHIEASANHNRAFDLIGWKVANEGEFGDTIAPIDAAIIALCAARPLTPEEATLKREYLKQELYPVVDGNEGMTKRVVNALLDAGGELEARPIDEPIGMRVHRLRDELAAALTEWRDGKFMALVYATSRPEQSAVINTDTVVRISWGDNYQPKADDPMLTRHRVGDVLDALMTIGSLNKAVILAGESISQGGAICAVACQIEDKLDEARDQLELVREALS